MNDLKPGKSALSEALASYVSRYRFRKAVIACSGGPDSVALVLAASESEISSKTFVVGHVNHGLRGKESDGDELFVRDLAKRLGLPVKVMQRPIRRKAGNLEAMARDLRYRALCRIARH